MNAIDIIKTKSLFRLGDVVVEELSEMEAAVCDRLEKSSWSEVTVSTDRGSAVQLASVHGPAILTLNDSFYPGWSARDRKDGKNLPIRPGNINFRAILLRESKDYNIEFVYRPQWLFLSELLACIAMSFWLVLTVATFLPLRAARCWTRLCNLFSFRVRLETSAGLRITTTRGTYLFRRSVARSR